MPYRIVTSFRPLSFVGATISLVGAVDADKATAWIGATTAIGAVLVPTLLDWHRKIRKARREERAADVVLDSELLAREVRKRVEIEGTCDRLRVESAEHKETAERHRKEISDNRHAMRTQAQTIANLQAQIDRLGRSAVKLGTKVELITPEGDGPPEQLPAGSCQLPVKRDSLPPDSPATGN